jgi:glycyl-tRNA synthetase beta chain
MADLLLEIFSEEIPARMQQQAIADLDKMLWDEIKKAGLFDPNAYFQKKLFVTPRRLTLWIGLPKTQPDVDTELKGPRLDAPEAAVQGFLKKSGLKLEQLEKRDGVYVAKIHQKGKPTAEVLKPIIEEILKTFPWPKSMRWGNYDITWVRPLHSVLCIFDGKVVSVEFGPVKADNVTYGHRFLSPKAITIKKADDYESALEKAHVIADRSKRREEIKKQADALAKKHDFTVKPDENLLDEVTGLVEWPVMLMGSIDKQFMDLPPEVLSTVMKKHQKYFSLIDKSGKLAPNFLITANMEA